MGEKNLLVGFRNGAVVGAFLIAVAACGSDETPDPQATSDSATRSPAETVAESADDSASDSVVRRFSFGVIGADPATPLPEPGELSLTGGCVGSSPLSIGFHSGAPHAEGYFGFSMNSAAPVASGQVGDVELARITWDNGVTTPANMPADSPVKVPDRFEGTGTLTLQSHSGRGMAGRMSGVVTGEVTQKFGDAAASLVVEFDINLACAN
jgi:hypothetical protein